MIYKTFPELLKAWDAGQPITTIEMGGMGQDYEYAIQHLAVELGRKVHSDAEFLPMLQQAATAAQEDDTFWNALNARFAPLRDEVIRSLDDGHTGAMVAAAVWLMLRWTQKGSEALINMAREKNETDRIITITNRTPAPTT